MSGTLLRGKHGTNTMARWLHDDRDGEWSHVATGQGRPKNADTQEYNDEEACKSLFSRNLTCRRHNHVNNYRKTRGQGRIQEAREEMRNAWKKQYLN